MNTIDKLKKRLRQYLKTSGETPTGFGKRVLKDPSFCRTFLDEGRVLVIKTADTVFNATSPSQARSFKNGRKKQ